MSRYTQMVEDLEGVELLRVIGDDLDLDRQPLIHDHGQVEPGPHHPRRNRPDEAPLDEAKEVNANVRSGRNEGSSRPPSGPREGTSNRGAPDRPGTKTPQAPVLSSPKLSERVRMDLQEAVGAYPRMRIRLAPEFIELHVWVWPLRGIYDGAFLLTRVPLNDESYPRAWAWWDTGAWIGPRHTNIPDGSICSHELQDGSWRPGRPLRKLIDLNVLWVVRHIHLRHLKRWPGRQVIHTSYERFFEQEPTELCGCDSRRRYHECCRESDSRTWLRGMAKFFTKFRSFERHPNRTLWPHTVSGT